MCCRRTLLLDDVDTSPITAILVIDGEPGRCCSRRFQLEKMVTGSEVLGNLHLVQIHDFEHAMWRKRFRVLVGTHNIVSDVFLGGVYVTEGTLHLRVPPFINGAVLLLMCTVNVVVHRSEVATILKRQATVWRGGSANFLCFAFQLSAVLCDWIWSVVRGTSIFFVD